ncbi:MAG TPA: tyrosine-type recombinase/integrase [Phycisphaerales bacterium]|nr:tyrosine-type recombinase/integrase [Phycisphaerales bacterium]
MASVIRDPKGLKRVQWCVAGGERRTLRLGSVSVRQAEAVRVRIEQVLAARSTGVMDCEATKWLESLDDDMHGKLSRLGLVPPRERNVATVGGLLAAYFENLNVKPGTRRTYEQTRTSLEAHFGKATALSAVTPLACDQWRQTMVKAELAPPTIAKRVKTARQIFKQAIRWKLATENPLADVKAGATVNRSRMFFVTREAMDRVLDACPDIEWRLIFAMARYGGVRAPSELLPLTWQDVDFDRGQIRIRSSKTEAYEGKDERLLPMFPELRSLLLEAFAQAEEGAERVITRHLHCGTNLRTRANAIIRRAGLIPWPKTFVNMRSSRATELAERFPQAVLTAWLGHSAEVSVRHYQQVLPEHHARAVAGDGAARGGAARSGGVAGAAARNAA